MADKLLWKIVFTILGLLLFIGGLGVEVELVKFFGVLVGALLVILIWLQKRKIEFPKFTILYSLFLILFLLHNFSVSVNLKKSLEVFSLFLGGGLFWLLSYNLKKELSPYFDKLIIFLGFAFAGLYFGNRFFGDPTLVRPWSLYLEYSAFRNHNNIGDLWALVLTVAFFYFLKNPNKILIWTAFTLGIYLLLISQSRAALVALFAGVFYIVKNKGLIEKYKKAFFLFILALSAIFLVIGTQKTTLFTRQYYLQAVLGIIHNPEGVGVGNFGVISKDPANHLFGLSHFSSNAHNIVLEIVAGMGMSGLIFVYWLIGIIREIWEGDDERSLVYRAVFITLFINFFFHSTYFVPTMLWLGFGSLGLSQKA